MKTYPSIKHSGSMAQGEDCHVFVKYDGSNLRFEWSQKQGWYKFGTRKTMFDESNEFYGPAINLFRQRYADGLEQVFRNTKIFRGIKSVVVFAEWFGKYSFAGQHRKNDPKTLILFDVNPNKKGFLSPSEFIDCFGHLEIAECISREKLDQEFIDQVKSGSYDCSSKYSIVNQVPEGVICKGGKGHNLWMCKIKTQNYLDQLKENLGESWEKYW